MEPITPEAFEELVERVFHSLPDRFRSAVDNVRIVVEDYPSSEMVARLHLRSRRALLGLYEGVSLPHRGASYGAWPVVPDTITLFRKNLEDESRDRASLERNVAETLIHELGHYFGMNEDEVRAAGY